jgi:hypothetical protein
MAQDEISETDGAGVAGFTARTLIEIRCGSCGEGEPFAIDGIGYMVAVDLEHAVRIVGDAGGIVLNEVAYCPACLALLADERPDGDALLAQVDDQPALTHDEHTARVVP